MSFYGGSVVRALIDVYPEVQFDKTKFGNTTSNFKLKLKLYFCLIPLSARAFNSTRRREIMDTFAASNKFDPNVPDNWYSLDSSTLLKDKVLFCLH